MCDAACCCDACIEQEDAEIENFVWRRARRMFEKAAAANNTRWDDLDDSMRQEWYTLASEGGDDARHQ